VDVEGLRDVEGVMVEVGDVVGVTAVEGLGVDAGAVVGTEEVGIGEENTGMVEDVRDEGGEEEAE
jgi:hypothetical protein